MKINGFEYRENLFYNKKHIWVKKMGKKWILGLDDIITKHMGDITDIEITYVDNELYKDDVLATIYYHGEIKEIFPPFAGKVVNVNEDLEEEPELLLTDPYGKGWLVEMENESEEDVDRLMSGDSAEEWFRREVISD
jgi:glycine cleavage system H protein